MRNAKFKSSPMVPESLYRLVGKSAATLPSIIEARARATPERIFLIFQDECWTYREMRQTIARTARFFSKLISCKQEPTHQLRVASYLSNAPEAIWTWLGTSWINGVYIPLNRQHKDELLKELIRRSKADILVTEMDALPLLAECIQECGISTLVLTNCMHCDVDLPGVDVFAFAQFDQCDEAEAVAMDPADIASIIFTSGTTGRSKAVMVPHNQYCRGAAQIVDGFKLNERDVFHNWLPLFHLGGQLHMTITAILVGGTVALSRRFSRSRFWHEIESTKASVLCGFAAILHFIWSLPPRPQDAQSTLRVGIIAGIPEDLHRDFEKRFGMSLGENYGMTEADPITLPGRVPWRGKTSGSPVGDFDLRILDQTGKECPANEVGNIVIKPRASGVMMLGYEGNEEASRDSFQDGWFRTGDLGRMDKEGYFHFEGRGSAYLRRRGENISVSELTEIFESLEQVEECAVVGVPCSVGEDDIKAVFVLALGYKLNHRDLEVIAEIKLASFMRPRFYEIRNALPKTELGKIILGELKNPSPQEWDKELQCFGSRLDP